MVFVINQFLKFCKVQSYKNTTFGSSCIKYALVAQDLSMVVRNLNSKATKEE